MVIVQTEDLSRRLEVARKVVAESYGSSGRNKAIRLMADDGLLIVTVSDGNTWANTYIDVEGHLDAHFVDPRDMSIVLKGCTTPEIGLTSFRNRLGVVRDGVDIQVPATAGFPAAPAVSMREVGSWDGDIFRMALMYMRPVCRSTRKGSPRGVMINGRHCVTTDGHRLHSAPLRGRMRGSAVITPGMAVLAAQTVAPDDRPILWAGEKRGVVRLQYGSWDLLCAGNNFPAYETILRDQEKNTTLAARINPSEVLSALRRLNPAGRGVKLIFEGDGFKMVAQHSGNHPEEGYTGSGEEFIPADTSGNEMVLSVSGKYLLDMFRTPDDLVTLGITGVREAIALYGEGGSLRALCMPLEP